MSHRSEGNNQPQSRLDNYSKQKKLNLIINSLTSHSLWPWSPSWLRVFTATVSPVPGFTGAVPFSLIQPLNTQPNPPSPRRLSGLKLLVADLSSLKVNFRSWEATFNSSLMLGVDGILSALLVVEDDTTGATGWSRLESFVDLLSPDPHKNHTIIEPNSTITNKSIYKSVCSSWGRIGSKNAQGDMPLYAHTYTYR